MKTAGYFLDLIKKPVYNFQIVMVEEEVKRASLDYLKNWINAPDRKPLVMRGARQVGKTWLIRQLAKICKKQLIELNFEKQPAYISFFSSNDVKKILLNLSTIVNQNIEPENTLLFLDEIQNAPQLLAKLRWFAEDLPQLAVVAAGSLLEFVLTGHHFSMPVGRISYIHLEPLSFEEFLLANNKKGLYEYLFSYDLKNEISSLIHKEFMDLIKEYILVGGMPAVVASWVSEQSLNKIDQKQNDLLATYRDDFPKYKGRIAIERLDEVMMAVPKMLGQKFVFTRANSTIQINTIKQAVDLLEKARISYRVRSTAANGVPLAAEIKTKYFKEIFLDVGLCSTVLGLNLNQIKSANEIVMVNNGGMTEQLVGQILRTIEPPYIEPRLYCWHREKPGSNAEIDYVIQHGNKVIPIEVKAGASGSLKSLHLFTREKNFPLAVRINSDLPSKMKVDAKNHTGHKAEYILLSLPFYLTGQIHRLIDLTLADI